MRVLVTGGAGFIGSNFIRMLLSEDPCARVVNVDALTYAGNLASLEDVAANERYTFIRGDVTDAAAMKEVFSAHAPEVVIHFAAESHVDRSILDAGEFVRTNVQGTLVLLQAAKDAGVERFVQVSTDEVYGSLGPGDPPFTEDTPIQPNSPYSASKAGADLLVRSYHHTHGLPVIITRCSNNYGPNQFPEKFIPLFITNALEDKPLPLYGDGKNIRDWIHVLDHCSGVWAAATKGEPGEVYNFGCDNEWANVDIAKLLLKHLEKPEDLIRFVKDRPGHDRRYAMGFDKAKRELGWSPAITFEQGLADTIDWYKANRPWWDAVKSGAYRDYYARWYGDR